MDEMQLLKLLETNPRYQAKDLADILGETEDEIKNTTSKLEKEKIIVGYHTVINWDKTNTDHVEAVIEVSAKPEREAGYDKIAAKIASYPEVTDLYLLSGKSEFLVNIAEKTMREIADFVGEKLAPIDGVQSTVTCFVLKKYKVEGVIIDKNPEVDDRQLVL